MEKIMNKSSKDNASRLGHSTFEDRTLDALDDAELTAVTGGGGKSTGKSTGISESLSLSYEQVKFEYTQQL
jgi:hypothetical protein